MENSCSFKDPLLGLSRMCGARGGLGSQAAESLEKEKEEGPTTQRFEQTLRQTRKKMSFSIEKLLKGPVKSPWLESIMFQVISSQLNVVEWITNISKSESSTAKLTKEVFFKKETFCSKKKYCFQRRSSSASKGRYQQKEKDKEVSTKLVKVCANPFVLCLTFVCVLLVSQLVDVVLVCN